MYEYINGKIADLTPTYVVIDAAGVGFFINISLYSFSQLENQSEAKIYVHYVVREDAQIMYGFCDKAEREIFRQLLSVSGVGGSTARMVLSTYSPSEVASIIVSENAVLLKNVKGLGIKSAQKIIVELKDKVASVPLEVDQVQNTSIHEEAIGALTMLGFSRAMSQKAVRSIIEKNPSMPIESIIKEALKQL